jgi:environmental stress-induced protein Ves
VKFGVLHRSDYRRMRWKNGSGWTTELARGPSGGDGDPFDWRVSVAEIDEDCDFSSFPGVDRTLMLLEGAGMELRFDDGRTELQRERGRVVAFNGESAVRCRLLEGPTRDFNVMTRRGAFSHRAWLRPIVGPMVLFPEPRVTWLIHVGTGTVQRQHVADAQPASAGDTLWLESSDDPAHVVISGSGELILVRLEALA